MISLGRVEGCERLADRLEVVLATIETASALFTEQVIEPALAAATGLERLRQLAENFLQHVEGNVYPGGCFFASVAAEMDTRPGPVRDHAVQLTVEWVQQLETAVRDSHTEGAIDPSEESTQLAFELRRLPAPRQRAVRLQSGVDADRPGTPRSGTPPRSSRSRSDHVEPPERDVRYS